jgi:non-lysosomal glucosylceramidase
MLTFPDVFIGERFAENYFENRFVEDGTTKAVVMKSSGGLGEWCIASAEQPGVSVSYVTSWNADGDGNDIWENFSSGGKLKNGGLDASNKGAAIAVKAVLKPGEEKVIPIVIAWDFPVVVFGRGTQWWKKYTRHFDRSGSNGLKIVKESLNNYVKWEQAMDAWMNPVINNPKYPDWLKTAAFNELYYSQFGGIFYEGGLKSGHEQEYMNLHPEDNKFFEMECMWYPFANTYDVRHYSSLVFAKFWPEIEKQVQMSFADAIIHFDPEHQTSHDVGSPADDPYFNFDTYGTNRLHWKDLHSKFIQQCWRYYYMHKDKEFLSYVWPACKATYGYMKSTDLDGDGLPDNNGSDNTYDAWGLYGTSLLCGGLWIGALEAMDGMAKVMNDPIEREISGILPKARASLDSQLWNKNNGYYNIDTKSKDRTAIMADGLNGQRYCESFGLADILPKDKMKSHLRHVYDKCVVPLHDFNGDGIGECGAINGINEDGTKLENGQSDEIWTGSSYYLAASMYHAGLKDEAMKTAYGVYYLCYVEESTAYWFNTPEAWKDKGVSPRPINPEQYQRPRAVWELLLEIDDPY